MEFSETPVSSRGTWWLYVRLFPRNVRATVWRRNEPLGWGMGGSLGSGSRKTSQMRRLLHGLFLRAAILLVAACVGPTFVVQQYKGPERPTDQIAILRVNGSDSVRLMYLDDADVAAPLVSDGRLHIEMLPARHVVVVTNAANGNERSLPLAFDAQAGKVYRVIFVPPDATPRVFEVNRASDAPGVDVTMPNAPPTPAPAPPLAKPTEPRPDKVEEIDAGLAPP